MMTDAGFSRHPEGTRAKPASDHTPPKAYTKVTNAYPANLARGACPATQERKFHPWLVCDSQERQAGATSFSGFGSLLTAVSSWMFRLS